MKTEARRLFLRGTLASGVVGVAAGAGLLTPTQVLAEWPSKAFQAKDVGGALTALFGTDTTETGEIHIKVPDIAENGAVVPVTVSTEMPAVESMGIIVEQNTFPLAAVFHLSDRTEASVSMRIKMGKTSNVIAWVKANGKLYSAKREVKVTIGGCGG